ncbi:hypothetical protein DD237_002325 [Peronospora effusa]|uniref:Uncharacterized protein n=1 Tax=Peronospora effusa TaxID=542832 RepID=A0A3R7YQR3_9STRA|nr:hypothetical protein DD237_002325 [Peronospora effusa]
MLERIPALKEILKKIACQNSFGHKVSNSEAKLGDAVHYSEQNIGVTIDAAVTEEDVVNSNLKMMKTDKMYVLNSIRFMDEEEAKAFEVQVRVACLVATALVAVCERRRAADTKSRHSFAKASPRHVAKVDTHRVAKAGPHDNAGPVKACITVQVLTKHDEHHAFPSTGI